MAEQQVVHCVECSLIIDSRTDAQRQQRQQQLQQLHEQRQRRQAAPTAERRRASRQWLKRLLIPKLISKRIDQILLMVVLLFQAEDI